MKKIIVLLLTIAFTTIACAQISSNDYWYESTDIPSYTALRVFGATDHVPYSFNSFMHSVKKQNRYIQSTNDENTYMRDSVKAGDGIISPIGFTIRQTKDSVFTVILLYDIQRIYDTIEFPTTSYINGIMGVLEKQYGIDNRKRIDDGIYAFFSSTKLKALFDTNINDGYVSLLLEF